MTQCSSAELVYKLRPDKIDQAIENFQKQVIPSARSATGYLGAVLLVDRKTGSGVGVTYWETAKHLSSSERVGIQTRTQAAKNVPGTQIINVERSEVVIMDRAQPVGWTNSPSAS